MGSFKFLCCFIGRPQPGHDENVEFGDTAQAGLECVNLDLYARQPQLLGSGLLAYVPLECPATAGPNLTAAAVCDGIHVAYASEALLSHLGCASHAEYLSRLKAWLTAEPELASQFSKLASCAARQAPGLLMYPLEEAVQLRDGMYSVMLTIRTCLVTGGEGARSAGVLRSARPALCVAHKLARLEEQSALRQQELALTSIPAIVTVLLLDGRVVYQNPRSQRYLGSLVGRYIPPPGASLSSLGACGHPLAGIFRFDAEGLAAFEEAMMHETDFQRVMKVPRRHVQALGGRSSVAGGLGIGAAPPALRASNRVRTPRERAGASRLVRQGSGVDAATLAAVAAAGGSVRSGAASREQSFSRVSPVSTRSGLLSRGPSRKGGLGATAASRAASAVFSRRSGVLLPLTRSTSAAHRHAATATGLLASSPLGAAEVAAATAARRLAPAAVAGGGARRSLRRCSSVADMAHWAASSAGSPSSSGPGRQEGQAAARAGGAAPPAGPTSGGLGLRQAADIAGPEAAMVAAGQELMGLPLRDTVTAPVPGYGDREGQEQEHGMWTGGLAPLMLLSNSPPVTHGSTPAASGADARAVRRGAAPGGGGGDGVRAPALLPAESQARHGGGSAAHGSGKCGPSCSHLGPVTHVQQAPARTSHTAIGYSTGPATGCAPGLPPVRGGQAPQYAGSSLPLQLQRSEGTSHVFEVVGTGTGTVTASGTAGSIGVLSDCLSHCSAGTPPASPAGASPAGPLCPAGAGPAGLGGCAQQGSPQHGSPSLGAADGGSSDANAGCRPAAAGHAGWAAEGPPPPEQVSLQVAAGVGCGAARDACSTGVSPEQQGQQPGLQQRHVAHGHAAVQLADPLCVLLQSQDSDESPFLDHAAQSPRAVSAAPGCGEGGGGGGSPRGAPVSPGARLAALVSGGTDAAAGFATIHRSGQLLSAIEEEGGCHSSSGCLGPGSALHRVLVPLPPEAIWSAGSTLSRDGRSSSGGGGELRRGGPQGSGGAGGAVAVDAADMYGFADGAAGDSSSVGQVPSLLLGQVSVSGGGGGPERRTLGRTAPCLPSLNLGLASGVLESEAGGGGGGGTSQGLSAGNGNSASSILCSSSSVVFQGFRAAPSFAGDSSGSGLPPLSIRGLVEAGLQPLQVQLHPPCVPDGSVPATLPAAALPHSVDVAASGPLSGSKWLEPTGASQGARDTPPSSSEQAILAGERSSRGPRPLPHRDAAARLAGHEAALAPAVEQALLAFAPAPARPGPARALTAPEDVFMSLDLASPLASRDIPFELALGSLHSQRPSSQPQALLASQDAAADPSAALPSHSALSTRCAVLLGSAPRWRSRLGMPDAVSSSATNASNATAATSAAGASPLRELEQAMFSIERGQLRVRHSLAAAAVGSTGGAHESPPLLDLRASSTEGAALPRGGVEGGGGAAGGGSQPDGSRTRLEQADFGATTGEIERLLLGSRADAPYSWSSTRHSAAARPAGGAADVHALHRTWTAGDVEEAEAAAGRGDGRGAAAGPRAASCERSSGLVVVAAAAGGGGGALLGRAARSLPKDAGAAGGPATSGGGRASSVTGLVANLDGVARTGSGSVHAGMRRRNTRDRLQRLLSSFTADGESDEEEAGDDADWHDVHVCVRREAASGRTLVVVTQTVVTEQVEVQRKLEALLEHEHKVLESIFPRHVIEHMTLQAKHRGAAAGGLGGGAGGSGGMGASPLASSWAHLRGSAMEALATSHRCVTVLFCDIVGFTEMCKLVSAMVVMRFLNTLYMRFDELVDIYGVYKVETIGDCYMVAGGLVRTDGEGNKAVIEHGEEDALHAVRVMSFAKAVLREAAEVLLPTTGEPVQLRIGLHSGPVMSGIVGDKMPRFCLFGDTVNTASRMESTCPPGSIHVSTDTRELLVNEAWVPSGGVFVKGKGVLETYVWAGHAADEDEETERRLKVYL